MADIANITIKKYDDTTDIVWTALMGAASDRSPAVWRSETASTISGNRPVLELRSRDNGTKTTRIVEWSFSYPEEYTDSTTGLKGISHKVISSGVHILPNGATDTTKQEAISQLFNLLDSALIRSCVMSGMSPV